MTNGKKRNKDTSETRSGTNESQSDVEIISADACPFAQHSRIVLLEKRVDFTFSEIDLKNKPDWFLRISPYSKVPVVVDGEIVARPMMYLALSYDHRLVDGREAVGFLVNVKETLEDPARLLLNI